MSFLIWVVDGFQKPLPATPWHGPYKALSFAPSCWPHHVMEDSNDAFSEDCLYLNVIRPNDYVCSFNHVWLHQLKK